MHFFQNTPIKQKLTILTMLTSGMALLLACIAFVVYDQVTYRRAMAAELSVLTHIFDDNVAAGLAFNDSRSIETTLNSMEAHPRILAAAVFDRSGQRVAKYQRAGFEMPASISSSSETNTRFESDRLDAFRPVFLDGEKIGSLYIGSDLRELSARLWRYAIIVSIVLILSSLAALALLARLQRIISGPISHLSAIANSVATDKDYSIRALKQGDDELGRLIDAFNGMLKEIQSRDSALREARGKLEERVAERTRELAGSVSLLNATLDSTEDGILAVDLSGTVMCSNQKFAALWKVPAELLEKSRSIELLEYVADQSKDPNLFLDRVLELHQHPGGAGFDVIELADGRVIERYVRPQRLGAERVGEVINFRDVTERKRAEEKLRQSEDRFRSLIENGSDIITLLAPDGTLLYESPSVQRMLGYSPEELLGQNGLHFVHPEDVSLVGGLLMKLGPVPGATGSAHYRFRHRDGSWRVLETLGRNLLHHPNVAAIVLNSRDITERTRAEAELEAIHKQLLDASRQAGMAEVATSVLHNVGNVLNSVNVSTTLLSEQSKKSKVCNLAKVAALLHEHSADLGEFITQDPKGRQLPGYLTQLSHHLVAEQATFLQETAQLRKNIEHIKDIVAMQQSYARVSGVTETMQITDLVEDALRMNDGALTRHDVEVIREFAAVPPVTIDKHKVLQVLVNLIRNAKYACDESGRTGKQITVRVANGEGRLQIAIIDNGVGIPVENLIRIFNHGFTTRKDGHGFGLHSAALAAKELGGALRVESRGVGQGATFTLDLPCATHPPASSDTQSITAVKLQPLPANEQAPQAVPSSGGDASRNHHDQKIHESQ